MALVCTALAAARRGFIAALSLVLLSAPLAAQAVELAKLAASDGTPDSRFGYALAIEGDRIVVGAPGVELASDAGAAYVFERRPHSGWIEVAKLTASNPQPEGHFGRTVAMSGNRVIIGAGAFFGVPTLGQAYVFERSASGDWLQVAELEPSDGAQGLGQAFGTSVALDGDRALVGAPADKPLDSPGAAYLFEHQPDGAWTQVEKLKPMTVYPYGHAGSSVALDGDRVLLGAPWDDFGFDAKGCSQVGSVAVFERDPFGGWTETEEFQALDAFCYGFFGSGLSLEKDRALVGSNGDDWIPFNAGSAYIFERTSLGWRQVAKLVAPDGSESDYFGGGVLSRDWALVRASKSYQSSDPGKAYLFRRHLNGEWLLAAEIGSSTGTASENFGDVVALQDGRAVIGAPSGDGVVPGTGIAYVFDLGH